MTTRMDDIALQHAFLANEQALLLDEARLATPREGGGGLGLGVLHLRARRAHCTRIERGRTGGKQA